LSAAYRLHRLNAAVGVPSNALYLPFNSLACLCIKQQLLEYLGGKGTKQGFQLHGEVEKFPPQNQRVLHFSHLFYNLILMCNRTQRKTQHFPQPLKPLSA